MESGAYAAGGDQYPVQFSVDYPDRDLNRLTTAFRIIVAIPIIIVLAALGSSEWSGNWGDGSPGTGTWVAGSGGAIVFFPALNVTATTPLHPSAGVTLAILISRFRKLLRRVADRDLPLHEARHRASEKK